MFIWVLVEMEGMIQKMELAKMVVEKNGGEVYE